MSHLDPRTNQCELEVQRIIHFQNLANQLPNAFIDTKKVTKSHISTANTPARIDVPVRQLTNESKIRLKREKLGPLEETIKMTDQFKIDKSIVPENCEISISYVHTGEKGDRNNIVINNIFAFQVASNIIRNDKDPEPRNVEECQHRNDWTKWKEAIGRVKLINKMRSFWICSPNT
ncbi:hypothetical protein AAG906_037420 [Vitis piasezkii]